MTKKKLIVIIAALLFYSTVEFGADLYLPSLESIGVEFQQTSTALKYSFNLFMICLGISQLIYGTLSDRFGRKRIAIIGLGIFTLGAIFSFESGINRTFFISRIIQGLGLGSAAILPFAMLRDTFEEKQLARSFSYLFAMGALASVAVYFLGEYFEKQLGWRVHFLVLTIYVFLILLCIALFLDETIHHKEQLHVRSIKDNYLSFLFHKRFASYLLAATCIYASLNFSQTIIENTRLNMDHTNFFLFSGFAYFLGACFNAFLVTYYKVENCLWLGFFLAFLFLILLATFDLLSISSTYILFANLSVIWFSMGILLPNATASAMEIARHAIGTASACIGLLFWLGSGLVMSLIADYKSLTLCAITFIWLGIIVLAFIFFLLGRREEKTLI